MSDAEQFYISSFSITTLIYKGIIMPEDIGNYYLDLQQTDLVTRLALVHQRFSTNTMPKWSWLSLLDSFVRMAKLIH